VSSKRVGVLLASAFADGLISCGSSGTCADNGVAGCPRIEGGLCVSGLVCYEGLCLHMGGYEVEIRFVAQ
jgi:hypothetical protein